MAVMKVKTNGQWKELPSATVNVTSGGGGDSTGGGSPVQEFWSFGQNSSQHSVDYLTIDTTNKTTLTFNYDIDCGTYDTIVSGTHTTVKGATKYDIKVSCDASVRWHNQGAINNVDYAQPQFYAGTDVQVCIQISQVRNAEFVLDVTDYDSVVIFVYNYTPANYDNTGGARLYNITLN